MKNIGLLFLILLSTLVFSQTKSQVLTEDQKASYYIGVDIAQNLKKQGFNIDVNLLTQAIKDINLDKKTLLPIDSLPTFMQKYMGKIQQAKMAEQKEKAQLNIDKGNAFLKKIKQNTKIKSTPSGIHYEVLQEGDKTTYPKAEDKVKVKYLGKLIDGTEFDGTDKNNQGNPVEIPLNGVIKGWTEGLQLMSKGAKYKFYIPSNLAYGEKGSGLIGPGELLIFDIELVDIINKQ